MTDWPSRRLRLLAFEVRMWRANACRRATLPVAVSLKRFCAPLWVFNFSLIFFGFGNCILQVSPLSVPALLRRSAVESPLSRGEINSPLQNGEVNSPQPYPPDFPAAGP